MKILGRCIVVNERYLFLFGGNTSLVPAHEAFIAKAGGQVAKIALLITYSPNWEKYLRHYEGPWKEIGINDYAIIMPDQDGNLDIEKAKDILNWATGIFIGGGHTPTYQRYYARSPMAELIKARYDCGVPVAGCSAGALISLQDSFISPDETDSKDIQLFKGIGLLGDILIGVHFTENHQQPYLTSAMRKLSINSGYGIDENACVVFKNEVYDFNIGSGVHLVTNT
jgi:cyanophycinase